jgi:antimicrobial peptide system SdpA family protein
MPLGVVDIPGPVRPLFKVFWPQGWAFFTKNPRSPSMLIYRKSGDGQWVIDDIGRNGELKYAFGWRRTVRSRQLEAGFLSGLAGDSGSPCTEKPGVCLGKAERDAIELSNPTMSPFLCGLIGLVNQEPLPWAWREAEAETTMHSRVSVYSVSCDEKP